jgi:hypothetical protein
MALDEAVLQRRKSGTTKRAAARPPIGMTPEEWQTRVDLAAAYRLAVVYGWTDLNNTHFSARIPGTEHFLLNPFGMLFDEITASSLIKLDRDGNILTASDYPSNPADRDPQCDSRPRRIELGDPHAQPLRHRCRHAEAGLPARRPLRSADRVHEGSAVFDCGERPHAGSR